MRFVPSLNANSASSQAQGSQWLSQLPAQQPMLGVARFVSPYKNSDVVTWGKDSEKQKPGSANPDSKPSANPTPAKPEAKPDAKTDQPVYKNGQASTWVCAFKIGFSLLVTGGINAFLFGVPLWMAAGLSAAVSATQSGVALKVHKEDTAASRKAVALSRKLMGRQKDYSPAGKEWSMVPIWAATCSALALVEATLNHGYRHLKGDISKGTMQLLNERREAIEIAQKTASPWLKKIYGYQLNGMGIPKTLMEKTKPLMTKLGGLGPVGRKIRRFAEPLLKSGGAPNFKMAYMWACGAAMVGAIFQTSLAAMMQARIDQKRTQKVLAKH